MFFLYLNLTASRRSSTGSFPHLVQNPSRTRISGLLGALEALVSGFGPEMIENSDEYFSRKTS